MRRATFYCGKLTGMEPASPPAASGAAIDPISDFGANIFSQPMGKRWTNH